MNNEIMTYEDYMSTVAPVARRELATASDALFGTYLNGIEGRKKLAGQISALERSSSGSKIDTMLLKIMKGLLAHDDRMLRIQAEIISEAEKELAKYQTPEEIKSDGENK